MKTRTLSRLLAPLALLVATAGAQAVPINAPVPVNAYISQGGLDWAWANPLPGGVDLSFQGGLGWRLPTAQELAVAPLATAFLFAGANVPFAGVDGVSGAFFSATNGAYTGDGACATPYFSLTYLHCDWQDGLGQPYGPWAGMQGAFDFAEQLVVRGHIDVPEPATLALLGLTAIGLRLRRRRHA